MASWADIQDYLNRTGQNITQAGQGQINAAVDQPIADARQRAAMQARQAAMNQVAGNPVINPPAPQGIPEVQPNSPTMTAADAQSRLNAMIQAPVSMQQTAAKLKAQADQDAADEAAFHQREDDTAGYSDYKPSGGRFQKLQTHPALTPSTDEDDEDNKAASGVKQTGTLGGV